MKPLFIVLEGTDGAGSTTASKLLVQTLNDKGIESVWTKEPSDGTIGRHIRRILKGEEIADEASMFPMFMADRHDHIGNFIRPELEQGNTVVCDRYAYSTWVYQQDNYGMDVIELMQRRCLPPNYTFVLECPVEECMRRMEGRDVIERYEIEEKQREYAKRYKRVPPIGSEQIIHLDSYDLNPAQIVDKIRREIGL